MKEQKVGTVLGADRSQWRRVTFGNVVTCTNENTRTPLADGLTRYVGLEHLEPNDLRIAQWGDVADGTTFTRVFRAGQVLFGKRRSYQRKAAIADFDGVCSGDILVFAAKADLHPDLLPFVVQSDGFFAKAVGTSAGSLSPRTKWSELAQYEFDLPPLSEQRRIAEVLWALEESKDQYLVCERNTALLSISVQSAFFNSAEYPSVTLKELITAGILSFTTGPFGTVLSASDYKQTGIPVVNPVNMKKGRLDVRNGPFVFPETAVRLDKYHLKSGDIALSRKGEMGKVALIGENDGLLILGSDCFRVRFHKEGVLASFFAVLLGSPITKLWLESQAHGTILKGLNEKLLSSLTFSLPPLPVQRELVAKIQQIEERQTEVAAHIARLRTLKRSLCRILLENRS